MAEKYTPLDLSFLSNGAAAAGNRQALIAQTIALARGRTSWQPSSDEVLAEFKKQQDAYASKSKPTFIKGFFDLLSTPLYSFAGGLDGAVKGIQEDGDPMRVAKLAAIGAQKSGLQGLKGATSMLDVLPGVDINDEWQTNPEDLKRFRDVNIRMVTGMSTEEAMKPENWPAIEENLRQQKKVLRDIPTGGMWDELLYPDLDKTTSQEDFLKRMSLVGIGEDIVGDPLNLASFGGKAAVTAGKGALEGVEAARAAKPIEDLGKVKNVPEMFKAKPTPKEGLPFGAAIPQGIPLPARVSLPKEMAEVGKLPGPGAGPSDDFIREVLGMPAPKTGNPVTDAIIATTDVPKTYVRPTKGAMAIGQTEQKKLAKDILELAVRGDKDWIYKAGDLMRAHPNMDFERTASFLDLAFKQARAGKGFRPDTFARGLRDQLKADALKAAEPGQEIIRAVKNAQHARIIKPGGSEGLRGHHAAIANEIIANKLPEITGQKLFTGFRSEEAVRRAIAKGEKALYAGPTQANIWNTITLKLGMADPKKYDVAVRIMRAINNHFESMGIIAHSASSIVGKGGRVPAIPLRLDQVAEAIGPQIMGASKALITKILEGDPKALALFSGDQQAALQALRQSSIVTTAPAIRTGIESAETAAKEITNAVASGGRKEQAFQALPKLAGESAAASGAGDAGAVFARKFISDRLAASDPVNHMFKTTRYSRMKLMTAQAKSITDPQVANRIGNNLYRAAQLPPPRQLGKLAGARAMVTEGLGAQFNAAYGMEDMRRIFLRDQGRALTTVAKRGAYFNKLAKLYPPKDVDLWHEAFRAAQMDSITTGRVSDLQKEISASIEGLIGGSGLTANALADSTVVGRSSLSMKELNAAMTRFGLNKYQFKAEKVKDFLGVDQDLRKGIEWITSWQYWKVDKPYDFMHKLSAAVEQTVRQKNMFDEIALRFGSDKRLGDVRYAVDHPRLKGYFFNEAGARQAERFIKVLNEVNTPSSKQMQYLDHVLSKLKAGMTIYVPSHHWTNIIGDLSMNWLAGVNNPIRYTQAQKVISSQKARYGDIQSFQKGAAGPEALKQAMARGLVGEDAGLRLNAAGNATIVTMRNGTKVTADMVYAAMIHQGVLPSARVLEEVTSDITSVLDKLRPFGGKVQGGVHALSEWRDHIPRIAQFVDGLAKSGKPFAQAIEDSADAVRKWHPDGLDLTKFERLGMKRIFPFYSWTRKAIPLMIEASFLNPAKVMAYPRLMEAFEPPVQGGTGTFPEDQMFPDWIRERGITPVAGQGGSYTVVNPSMPAMDVMTMLGRPGGTALDMLNPMGKVPLELAQGSTLGKQVPIENEADYLAKQIPGVSHAGRISGYYGASESAANDPKQRLYNLLNLLTGAKATNTGIYQKSAQFDLKDYMHNRRVGER